MHDDLFLNLYHDYHVEFREQRSYSLQVEIHRKENDKNSSHNESVNMYPNYQKRVQ